MQASLDESASETTGKSTQRDERLRQTEGACERAISVECLVCVPGLLPARHLVSCPVEIDTRGYQLLCLHGECLDVMQSMS